MLQCRAKVTFRSHYGMLRAGERVTVEPWYFDQANRKIQQLELIEPDKKPAVEPSRRAVITEAPKTKKEPPIDQPPLSPSQTERDTPKDDGEAKPLSASRAGRVSRKKTSRTSKDAPDAS